MKRIVGMGAMTALLAVFSVGCNKGTAQLNERIETLEKRIETLEKKPAMPARQAPPEQTAAYDIPVGNSPVLGNKAAKVSVTIFSDYQCPYCSRTDPFLQEIVKDPDLKDKINVVFKHFPLDFHQNAMPAAKASLAAAEQGKFWEMTAKLYGNQQDLTAENFKKFAKEIGLDSKKFEKDLTSKDAKYKEMIEADKALGAKIPVRGTPSIYVGGWELEERSVDGVKNVLKKHGLM